jgi:uncharacterized protein with von Willebrand factor type A (vWA) domain
MTPIFITPGSEAFFKSGLAKSAFNNLIYREMPLDYFLPGIDMTTRLAKLHRITPKFYQAHDLFMAFYQPYEVVFRSLKKSNKAAPAWRTFVEGLIRRPEFLELNQITHGSVELAAAAAARTLSIVLNMRVQISSDAKHTYDLDALNQIIKDIEQNNAPAGLEQEIQAAGGVQKYLRLIERRVREAGKAAAAELDKVTKELQQYIETRREAEAAAAQLAGGHSFSLEGLSVWHFMERPDEFRRRVKLLVGAAFALRRFSRVLPASLSHQQAESLWGGVDGVAKMAQYAQLKDALPSELALSHISRELFAVKLAQMSLMVYRRAVAAKYVVFVDKSGSMAEPLTGPGLLEPEELREYLGAEERISVPKISLATGLALALYHRLRTDIYLFDTEVDRVAPRDVIATLLTIKADGGTNIARVMEEIMQIDKPDNIYVIISDGITDADKELTRRFVERCGPRTRLILIPPSGENYQWIQMLKRYGNVAYARDVAQFEEAVRRIFTHTL